ncbi:MAG: phage-shock protein [Desulfotomaculaceae bacterium]|nr:phage-shock protein [Desulfotomaculaceae bacterium]
MAGKLNSLTDVLKKTLFFFEALSVGELAPHVHRRMLKDYTLQQVEEKVNLCLGQNECFYREKEYWRLNLEGDKDNDQFYSLLLKKGQPQNLRDISKNINARRKKVKKLFSEEASLISDGRFIQLANGYWGLTEWEVETSHYSLKNLVIKAMKIHPGGLSIQQLHQLLNTWRETDSKTLESVLNKFPYFETVGEGVWSYNPTVRVVYEELLKKFLSMIDRQKQRWHRDRNSWKSKSVFLQNNLEEAMAGHREVAAALAEKMELTGQHDYLLTQMAEKDLLLSLRKREIFRYREHINKLESKSNSILYQCRLWVRRARESQEEIARQKEILAKNQGSLEGLFSKLQQYKEKDRENKVRLSDLKEQHSTRVAELQTEIIELKQKVERIRNMSAIEEHRLHEEINSLSNDLKKSLRVEEEQQRSFVMAQQELAAARENCQEMESKLRNPLVRIVMKICSLLKRRDAKTTI